MCETFLFLIFTIEVIQENLKMHVSYAIMPIPAYNIKLNFDNHFLFQILFLLSIWVKRAPLMRMNIKEMQNVRREG